MQDEKTKTKGGVLMREIKFRAWYCGYMYYSIPSIDFNKCGVRRVNLNNDELDWCHTPDTWMDLPHEDGILMQYTGLKDKNGKEIYEGDIVNEGYFALNDSDTYGKRPWENLPEGIDDLYISRIFETYKIEFTPIGLYKLYLAIDSNPDIRGVEVIGNIYENPELLK